MITLVPYDNAWPKLFENEKGKLKQTLTDVIVGIEHIGSTAIPEIYAKPVIDILIGVKDLKYFNQEHINIIKSLGYQYIQEYEEQLPHRRFFVKNDKEVIELTYSLTPNYWGKGVAVEIGKFAINYAFNHLRLDNIVCFTMTKNVQSLSVMEKLGFKYEKDFIHFNLPHKLYKLNNSNE